MWCYVNCSPDGSSATTQSPITQALAATIGPSVATAGTTGPSVGATREQPPSLGITCIAMSTVTWVLHTLKVASSNPALVFLMCVFFLFFVFSIVCW